jgi:hypothetical protein
MATEQQPHPGAVAYLDALAGDGWLVEVVRQDAQPTMPDSGPYWAVTVARDDVRQVTTSYSRAVAIEKAAWHHGARWQ